MKTISIALVFLALSLVASPAAAEAELLLQDGQVLRGVEVRREGDQYLLELESGDVLSLPAELLKEVRFGNEGPTDLVPTGDPVTPPRPAAQREVLGEPARFAKSPVRSDWEPTSSFDAGTDVLAGGRAEWPRGVIAPDWRPDSAFDARHDVLEPGRARWRESVIDPCWQPRDGFS